MTELTRPAEWARAYRQRGWSAIPLKPEDKEPVERSWQRTIIAEEDVDTKFTDKNNVGISLGFASNNLVDVDLDCAEAVALAPHFLKQTGLIFGRIGKPNSHYLYEVDAEDAVRRTTYIDPDSTMLLEIRGTGHQTMVPPSIHPYGEQLEWSTYDDAGSIGVEELERRAGYLATAVMLGRHWHDWDGQHHAMILHLTGGLLRNNVQVNMAEALIKAICYIGGENDWSDRAKAVQSTAEKIEAGESEVTGFPRLADIIGGNFVRLICQWLNLSMTSAMIPNTDHGNAIRMVEEFGHNLRYVPDWGSWIIWDGNRWRVDKAERIYTFARDIPQKIAEAAAKIPDDDKRKDALRWSMKSQDASRLAAMIRLAKTDPALTVDSNDLDADPWLLTVANGTLNLRTGGLTPSDPKNLITKMAPVAYDAAADAPMWQSYLETILQDDAETIAFVQCLAGYSLTGLTEEQVFTILWGPPGTGKTTFIETMRRVMGDYATNAEASTFMAKGHGGRATPELARLQGARLVTSSETEQGGKMAIALVKHLSGGDRMTASNLYAPPFEFDPVMKLWIATNHKPRIPADEAGIWQRLIMVPFTKDMRTHPDRVKDMADALSIEHPGILAWAVQGALQWRRNGLGRPAAVTEAIQEYKNESDEVGDFLDELTEPGEAYRASASNTYQAYKTWAMENGFRPLNIRNFKAKMEGRGFIQQRVTGGMMWLGIRLNEPTATGPDLNNLTKPFGTPNRRANA